MTLLALSDVSDVQNELDQAETTCRSLVKAPPQKLEERRRERGLTPGNRNRKEGVDERHIREKESRELINCI